MNHGQGSDWKMWLGMLLCCAAMLAAFALLGTGALLR